MKFILVFLVLIIQTAIIPQSRYITVTGNSEIIRKADQAEFSILVKTIGETVEASKIKNDKHLVELYIILRNMNIPSDEINQSPISAGKNYEYGDRGTKHSGYFTSVTVSFILKDLKQYYSLTNKLVANDALEISAAYSLSDYEVQNRAAYEKSVAAAKNKAAYLTNAAGVMLGEVLEIEEDMSTAPFPRPLNTISREIDGTGISGNVSISRTVRMKFEIHSSAVPPQE